MRWTPLWGDVPTWLAVVAAVYAGVGAKNLLKVETARDQRAEDREIRSQANQIAGWIFASSDTRGTATGQIYRSRIAAKVSNPSLQPIYSVSILWRAGDNSLTTQEIKLIAPNSSQPWMLPEHLQLLADPDLGQLFEGSEQEALEKSEALASVLKIAFQFRDSQGKWWRRGFDGILSPLQIQPD